MLAHYYGWTDSEIENLSADAFSGYLLSIDVIDSRQVLRACTANDWPNMKPKDRSELYRRLNKAASPIKEKKQALNTSDFAKLFGVDNVRR